MSWNVEIQATISTMVSLPDPCWGATLSGACWWHNVFARGDDDKDNSVLHDSHGFMAFAQWRIWSLCSLSSIAATVRIWCSGPRSSSRGSGSPSSMMVVHLNVRSGRSVTCPCPPSSMVVDPLLTPFFLNGTGGSMLDPVLAALFIFFSIRAAGNNFLNL